MRERQYLWLVIRCVYTLADGTKRVYTRTASERVGLDPQHIAQWRNLQFRYFDADFPRELQKRGEFYGSTIGAIQSREEVRADNVYLLGQEPVRNEEEHA